MTYLYDNIEWEITSACNAACPQCPRNYFGSYVWKNLPIVQIDLNWVKRHLPADVWKNIKKVDFCGTYGDPILNNDLIKIVKWLKEINPSLQIVIKTNGGIKTTNWWATLGNVLGTNDYVIFGIDGLEDTNHIYRRRVNYQTVISNAEAFISAGGRAFWSFIVFKHNQHQVEQAKQIAKNLGFEDFIIKKTWRFVNKNHEYQSQYPVYNTDGNLEYFIEPPTDKQYLNDGYQKIDFIRHKYKNFKTYLNQTTIDCNNKRIKKIYITSEGYVFPCGWLHDRMYGFEAEQHSDHKLLYKIIDQAGGISTIDLNQTPIDQIVNGNFFDIFQQSWTNQNRLERCSVICGQEPIGIATQNQWNNTL